MQQNTSKAYIIEERKLIKYVGTMKVVEIPREVEAIQAQAFENLNLDKVVIPNTVQDIEPYAFTKCCIRQIVFEMGSKLTQIKSYSFHKIRGVIRFDVPESILEIESNAIDSVMNITIPDSVAVIGQYAVKVEYSDDSHQTPGKLRIVLEPKNNLPGWQYKAFGSFSYFDDPIQFYGVNRRLFNAFLAGTHEINAFYKVEMKELELHRRTKDSKHAYVVAFLAIVGFGLFVGLLLMFNQEWIDRITAIFIFTVLGLMLSVIPKYLNTISVKKHNAAIDDQLKTYQSQIDFAYLEIPEELHEQFDEFVDKAISAQRTKNNERARAKSQAELARARRQQAVSHYINAGKITSHDDRSTSESSDLPGEEKTSTSTVFTDIVGHRVAYTDDKDHRLYDDNNKQIGYKSGHKIYDLNNEPVGWVDDNGKINKY